METVFDWVAIGIFAGLIVLFLQRSTGEGKVDDHLWQYLAAAAGCAVFNYLGNEGHLLLAVGVLVAIVGFIAIVLKPFGGLGRP